MRHKGSQALEGEGELAIIRSSLKRYRDGGKKRKQNKNTRKNTGVEFAALRVGCREEDKKLLTKSKQQVEASVLETEWTKASEQPAAGSLLLSPVLRTRMEL
jgi:hypothetical protein